MVPKPQTNTLSTSVEDAEQDQDALDMPDDAMQIISSLPPKQQAVAILRDSGLSNGEVAKSLGLTTGRISQIDKKLSKLMLTGNAKRGKLAVKAYDALLRGQPVGEVKTVKDSTVLQAAQMWLDRNDPIRRADQDTGSRVSYTQVNINISNAPREHQTGDSNDSR